MCIRRGSISEAALASSPLWPRCAAVKTRPAFASGVGEALKPRCRVVRINASSEGMRKVCFLTSLPQAGRRSGSGAGIN
jgi:hypothetical protein